MQNLSDIENAVEPKCECTNTEIRIRIVSGGGEQWVYQCLRCGTPSTAIARSKIPAHILLTRKTFDNELRTAWDEKVSNFYKRRREWALLQGEIQRRDKNSEWWINYNTYLETSEWADKRRRVIQRDPICKGCGVNKSSQAHHLTYDHLFNEFLFEIVGVCTECHERLHSDATQPQTSNIRAFVQS